jgi:ribose/xylose/arabinose/galactoside ABC-type transport system permease subunit
VALSDTFRGGVWQGAGSRWRLWERHRPILFLYSGLTVLVIYGAVRSSTFLTTANVTGVMRQSILLGLAAIGQSLVVIAGGIDFSIGQNIKVSGIAAATTFAAFNGQIVPAVAAGLLTGAAIGLVNGLLITRVYNNPFIITFGTYWVLQGLALALTSTPVTGVPRGYLGLYDASLGPLPWCVLGMAVVWGLAWILMHRTGFGRSLYAIGGSAVVARLSGIRVSRQLVTAYMITGLFGGAAGLFSLAQSGVAGLNNNGLEFASIVAVAVGGISLAGGTGSVAGALGGVLLLGVVTNLLTIQQISEFWQAFVTGAIILVAVAGYKQVRR